MIFKNYNFFFFFKIGGILVISLNGSLIKVERKSENSWNLFEELQVSFKDLILPERCNLNKVKFRKLYV